MLKLVGIVGGIGSGKSAVSKQFQQLGAEVLDGDRLGHEVLADPEVVAALRARWGERIVAAADPTRIDRSEVAKIVFAGTAEAETELRYLESLTHPRIRKLIRSRLADIQQQATETEHKIVILDAPLLLEAGWNELCEAVIYIDCPQPERLQRLAARNWTAADLAAREARQLPLAEKRRRADYIIDNSGPLEQLLSKIEPIWRSLTLPKTA